MTTAPVRHQRADVRSALEARGAEIAVAADGTLRAALECLGGRDIGSLLLEGGAAVHQAAWDEGVVDFVRLYVTPHVLGTGGVRVSRAAGRFRPRRLSSGASSRSDPMC